MPDDELYEGVEQPRAWLRLHRIVLPARPFAPAQIQPSRETAIRRPLPDRNNSEAERDTAARFKDSLYLPEPRAGIGRYLNRIYGV